jgi:maleamate amidohydrolase
VVEQAFQRSEREVTKRIWDDLITDQDRQVYGSGVFGGTVGIGNCPAVLVIDVLNKSIGDEPLPILEAMQRFGKSCCGEYGWATIPKIQAVVRAAHDAGLPVFYTTPQDPEERPAETFRRFDEKMPNWYDYSGKRAGYAFADEIAPIAGDHIFHKPTASSFYLTNFEDQLHKMDVDTLIVTGCATSGCVRASVVDAHARGFKVNVIEDAVFDRGQVAHAMNLFDMHAKYADVIDAKEAVRRIEAAASNSR